MPNVIKKIGSFFGKNQGKEEKQIDPPEPEIKDSKASVDGKPKAEKQIEKQVIEELCEIAWTLREGSNLTEQSLLEAAREKDVDLEAAKAEIGQWIAVDGKEVKLTEAGEKLGETIVRRHRLAERLLSAVLELGEQDTETSACAFEHIISESVADSICSFLGHPPVCPHGKPIPLGECCARKRKHIKPLIQNLLNIPIGSDAKIAFIHPRDASLLNRLSALGIVSGSPIKVRAHHPSYVVEIGPTILALDRDVASEIYVREEG